MLENIIDSLGLAVLTEPWVPKVLLTITATVLINFIAAHILRRTAARAANSSSLWDDTLVHAAQQPLPTAVWVVGLALAADIVRGHVDSPLFGLVPPLRDAGVVLCIAWFLFRLVRLSGDNYVTSRKRNGEEVDQTTIDALSKLGRLTIVIAAALICLQTFGFSVSGVLAAGGIGGLAIGFAAKDILANFFGGLTIYLDRPFSVGEWIRSPDKQIEGTVEAISWRHTRIRAFNKNPIYVPNAIFTTIVIENPSRMSHRRIKKTIGVRYADLAQVKLIVDAVREMLRSHPEIDNNQTLIVNFDEFAESSLNFFIYTFTRTTDWVRYHKIKEDILLRIAQIIADHGAEIAFPTMTLHMAAPAESSPTGD
ncbi:MAG: mechanosensitive ion channel family protein [Rhodocyclaceae bacterium]|nr:mechanosensitive ion channel family protein [Rhodocyclaceae bacterium]